MKTRINKALTALFSFIFMALTPMVTFARAQAAEETTAAEAEAAVIPGVLSVILQTLLNIISKNWALIIIIIGVLVAYLIYKHKQDPMNKDDL